MVEIPGQLGAGSGLDLLIGQWSVRESRLAYDASGGLEAARIDKGQRVPGDIAVRVEGHIISSYCLIQSGQRSQDPRCRRSPT